MTRDDAIATLTSQCPWLADVDLACLLDPATSLPELEAIVAAYAASGVPATGDSSWDTVLKVLHVVGDVAGIVLPAVGVVQAVVSLARS